MCMQTELCWFTRCSNSMLCVVPDISAFRSQWKYVRQPLQVTFSCSSFTAVIPPAGLAVPYSDISSLLGELDRKIPRNCIKTPRFFFVLCHETVFMWHRWPCRIVLIQPCDVMCLNRERCGACIVEVRHYSDDCHTSTF